TVAAMPLQVALIGPEIPSISNPVMVWSDPVNTVPLDGERIVIPGGVLSRLTVAVAAAVFPAISVALPLTTWLAPSAVTATGAVTDPTPERLSVAWKLTVTLELFHPFAFGAGLSTGVKLGGVLSILSVTEA